MVQDKSIQPVRYQHNGRRETSNSMLARGRPQDTMHKCKRGKKMIQWLESEYGEMHRSSGKKHNYLGMCLDYSI